MKNKKDNQKTYPLNIKGYSLKIIRSSGSSNQNTSSSVFRVGEKNPLFGTSHNDKSTDNEILDWANQKLEKHLLGSDDKELLNMLQQII